MLTALAITTAVITALSPSSWNIAGLVLMLIGVVLLFRYGMPYRVRTGGATNIIARAVDANEIKAEKFYARLGWIGLASTHAHDATADSHGEHGFSELRSE